MEARRTILPSRLASRGRWMSRTQRPSAVWMVTRAWGCNLPSRKAPLGSLSLASSLLLLMTVLVPGPGVKSTPSSGVPSR